MLKKSEGSIYIGEKRCRKSPIARAKAALKARHALGVLMAQYAGIGRKDEVYRLWNLHKKPRKFFNRSYSHIITSLLTLDDIDGAQKMLDEWLSNKVKFHIGVPNLLVTAYCEKGYMEKAEAIICSVLKMGAVPNASTWSRLALGYCKKNQMGDAVKMLKRVITSSYPGWRPDLRILAPCLKFLKEKGYPDGDEIIAMLVVGGKFSDDYMALLLRCITNGNPSSTELCQMEQETNTLEEEVLY